VLSELFVAVGIGAAFLTYANGANDDFKGVATLYGSGRLADLDNACTDGCARWRKSVRFWPIPSHHRPCQDFVSARLSRAAQALLDGSASPPQMAWESCIV
jgi:hypothetical protein